MSKKETTPKIKLERKLSEARKKLIAGTQCYLCANEPNSQLKGLENYDCPVWKKKGKTRGCFDQAGYEIDHIMEHSITADDTDDNLHALCHSCHMVKTKKFLIYRNTKANKDNCELKKENKKHCKYSKEKEENDIEFLENINKEEYDLYKERHYKYLEEVNPEKDNKFLEKINKQEYDFYKLSKKYDFSKFSGDNEFIYLLYVYGALIRKIYEYPFLYITEGFKYTGTGVIPGNAYSNDENTNTGCILVNFINQCGIIIFNCITYCCDDIDKDDDLNRIRTKCLKMVNKNESNYKIKLISYFRYVIIDLFYAMYNNDNILKFIP